MKALQSLFIVLFLLAGARKAHAEPVVPRLRGAMITTWASAQDLRELAALGANHVRWQVTWGGFPQSPADTASPEAYRNWLRPALRHIRLLLPLCDSLGLRVVLDLHTLPGGAVYKDGGLLQHRIFSDLKWQREFIRLWEEIAITFRNAPALWAYDLANEPVEGPMPAGVYDWQNLAAVTARAIRALDPSHTLIAEGAPGGGVPGLLRLKPLPDISDVVYSFHIYDPIEFTHQGIINQDTLYYPGKISGKYWDAAALREWMQPVRDWQLRYGARIYVGEFSAVRWAPDSSAYRYIRDCIALFEEWGWSWAYHAWREWGGWSLEYGSRRDLDSPPVERTDRQMLLEENFRKNKPF